METITGKPVRTIAFLNPNVTSEDFMLNLAIKVPDLGELPCDLFMFSHIEDDMPDQTVSWVSPTAHDGWDVFWRFVDARLLDCHRSVRQIAEDLGRY